MPSQPPLATAYWNDPRSKAAFCELARDCFGLDFSAFDAAGYWDDAYRPFTFFDSEGRALANVCAYSMDLVVAGRPVRAVQLSTVATRPEFRRQGLARVLVDRAVDWARASGHEFTYLFANNDALGFYSALGFRPLAERSTTLLLDRVPTLRSGARILDLSAAADRDLLFSLATNRTPVSAELGAHNGRLLMFHALGSHRSGTVHIPSMDTVVLLSRSGGTLTLFDVVARRLPSLADLLPYIGAETDREIEFRFMPEGLGDLSALGRPESRPADNGLHVRGTVPLQPGRLFPATSQA